MTTYGDLLRHLGGVPVMAGVPYSQDSQYFFMDPARGSDDNDGTTPETAVASLEAGYAKLTANQHDGLFYIAGASGNTLTAKLTWSKNYTHLLGIAAPTNIAQRTRVFYGSALATTPMFNHTATGNIFKNLYFFHGVASTASLICFQVTGGRNYYLNVHFAGIGHATGQGDVAAARSLLLAGAEECLFERCTIGVDTIARSAANAQIEFTNQARRITFENCKVLSYADSADALMVKAATNGNIDRWIHFKNTLFQNVPTDHVDSALNLTSAFNIASGVGGTFILENPMFVGCDDIAATGSAARIRILGHSSDDYSDYSAGAGLAIQPT